jgi:hypothetical protein
MAARSPDRGFLRAGIKKTALAKALRASPLFNLTVHAMAKLGVLEPVQHDQCAFDPAESRADVDELAATAVEL